MVRLSPRLLVRLSPRLRFGNINDEPAMSKINLHIDGFDFESLRHNWSLYPLFVCSIVGGIVAWRYTWHLTKPAYDLENYEEKMIFGFQPFHSKWTPMYPRMLKETENTSDA